MSQKNRKVPNIVIFAPIMEQRIMNFYMRAAIFTAAIFLSASGAYSQKMSREEYIEKYKSLAIEDQEVYGIPASIKLAQAMLESDNGNSRLARAGNNHFGIKCKSDWTGQTIKHDDDAPQECFRKYATVEESFRDHAEFLDKSPRYQFLFDLEPTDYKGWAYGLSKAGYATNPKYPELLIKIIEDNQLYLLDQGKQLPDNKVAEPVDTPPAEPASAEPGTGKVDIDNYVVAIYNHEGYDIYLNNGSKFIIAKEDNSIGRIAAVFSIKERKLRKYNDMQLGDNVKAGDMVYINPKNKRSDNGRVLHTVEQGQTMRDISQIYGIKLKKLQSLNRYFATGEPTQGQQIRLM